MITLSEYLYGDWLKKRGGKPGADEASRRVLQLVLEGLLTRLPRAADEEFQEFENTLKRVLRHLQKGSSPMAILQDGADILSALEIYSERIAHYYDSQADEMQKVVRLMSEAVEDFSGASRESIRQLHGIESQIQRASLSDDIRAMKVSLSECLQTVRNETGRLEQDVGRRAGRLKQGLDHTRARLEAAAPRLPALSTSEREGEVPEEPQAGQYAAVFVLQKSEGEDPVLMEGTRREMTARLGEVLKKHLFPADRLLRWKGSSYLALLERPGVFASVRSELEQLGSELADQRIEVSGKSLPVDITYTWTLMDFRDYPGLDALFTDVDAFAAGQADTPHGETIYRPVRGE